MKSDNTLTGDVNVTNGVNTTNGTTKALAGGGNGADKELAHIIGIILLSLAVLCIIAVCVVCSLTVARHSQEDRLKQQREADLAEALSRIRADRPAQRTPQSNEGSLQQ